MIHDQYIFFEVTHDQFFVALSFHQKTKARFFWYCIRENSSLLLTTSFNELLPRFKLRT